MNPHDRHFEREILPFPVADPNVLSIAQAKQAERRRQEKNCRYEAAYGGRPLRIADFSVEQQLFALPYGRPEEPKLPANLDGMNPYEVFSRFMVAETARPKSMWPRTALFVLAGLAILAACLYVAG